MKNLTFAKSPVCGLVLRKVGYIALLLSSDEAARGEIAEATNDLITLPTILDVQLLTGPRNPEKVNNYSTWCV